MKRRTLQELPTPTEEHVGWPWSSECVWPVTDAMPPRISVITPSYCQGSFIERTIRSVLLQGYPNLEYIVIDGNSTDGTRAVLERYSAFIDYWISEKDRGQSHAINKGLATATGEILCWLNSDDWFLPGTLHVVGTLLAANTGNFALVGNVVRTHADGSPPVRLLGRYQDRLRLLQFWKGYQMHQPAIFWRREVVQRVGLVDESLHLIMDFDYWVRISEHFDFLNVDLDLACTHYHDAAKTGDGYAGYHADLRKYAHRYWKPIWSREFWQLQASMTNHFFVRPTIHKLRSIAGNILIKLTQ
jgi:glycosyltransferase involved in cell wall biosynthesis